MVTADLLAFAVTIKTTCMFIQKQGVPGTTQADYEHTSLKAGDYVFKKNFDTSFIFKRMVGDQFQQLYFEEFEFGSFDGVINEEKFINSGKQIFSAKDFSRILSVTNLVPKVISRDDTIILPDERSVNPTEAYHDKLYILEERK